MHELSSNTDTDPNWPLQLYTMGVVMDSIQNAFPGIIILPVIGNNDVQYHNQAPNSTDAPSYYADMWEIYVTNVAANSLNFGAEQLATFSNGGYYAFPFPGTGITVLSLNGMYPFSYNQNQPQMATTMIQWVDTYIQNNPDQKYIIQYHVFPGTNYFQGFEQLWAQPYLDQLLQVLANYNEKIILSIGAHIHHIEAMAPQSVTVPGVNVVQVIVPAVSPVYGNNPGIGLLQIDPESFEIDEMTFKFF